MKALLLAVVLFVAQGLWFASTMPLWSEQTSAIVAPTFSVVDPDGSVAAGGVVAAPACAGLTRSEVRPVAYVCAGGLSWPVLGSPYASAIAVWPLGVVPWLGGTVLHVRMAGLLIGVLGLLLLFAIARRLEDDAFAGRAVVLASVLSPFLMLHALAVYYELVPTWLILLGFALWARSPTMSAARAAFVGFLWSFAILSNVKALVILTLLLVGVRVLAPGRWPLGRIGLVLLGTLPVAALLVLLAATDPHAGVASQLDTRIATFFAHMSPSYVLFEAANVAMFAADFGFYTAIAAGGELAFPWTSIAGFACAAFALAVGTSTLWQAVRGRPASRLAAVSMVVVWGYVLFVALVYQQTPSANYGPIIPFFPLLLAHATRGSIHELWWSRLARALRGAGRPPVAADAERAGHDGSSGRPWTRPAVALPAVVLPVVFAVTTHLRQPVIPTLDPHLLTDVATELRRLARPTDAAPVTLTYNQAGVFDALAPLPQPTLAAHRLFADCDRERPDDCIDSRMALVACGRASRLVVVPRRTARVDEEIAGRLAAALRRAADRCGATLQVEAALPAHDALVDVVRVAPKAAP